MFYTCGGVWMPHICMPHTFVHPIQLYAPRGVHIPICPHTLLCLCVFLEALHVVGSCNGFHFVLGHPPLHHPCLGVPPLHYTPHTQLLVSCTSVCFRDINMLCGHFGFGGVSPISWGVGASALEMSICSFLYLFCNALCHMFQIWLRLLLLQLQW